MPEGQPIAETIVEAKPGPELPGIYDNFIPKQSIRNSSLEYKEVQAGPNELAIPKDVLMFTAWGFTSDMGLDVFWRSNPIGWVGYGGYLGPKYSSHEAGAWAEGKAVYAFQKAATEMKVAADIAKEAGKGKGGAEGDKELAGVLAKLVDYQKEMALVQGYNMDPAEVGEMMHLPGYGLFERGQAYRRAGVGRYEAIMLDRLARRTG